MKTLEKTARRRNLDTSGEHNNDDIKICQQIEDKAERNGAAPPAPINNENNKDTSMPITAHREGPNNGGISELISEESSRKCIAAENGDIIGGVSRNPLKSRPSFYVSHSSKVYFKLFNFLYSKPGQCFRHFFF